MFDDIKDKTGGQLSVRLNLGGTLPIAATNITQAVSDNVVQLGDDAFFVGSVPVGGVVRLPHARCGRARLREGLGRRGALLCAPDYDKKNIVLLGRYIFPRT